MILELYVLFIEKIKYVDSVDNNLSKKISHWCCATSITGPSPNGVLAPSKNLSDFKIAVFMIWEMLMCS